MIQLSGLSIVTAVQDGKNIAFDPAVNAYTFQVQSDCYGVKIIAEAPETAVLRVNGNKVVSGEGIIVPIDGSYESYDIVLETAIEIAVSNGAEENVYTINVIRDCDTDTYNLFQPGKYVDEETGETIPYELYVPTNYDPAKKYPVVFALHGSGQRNQSVDMVLKRYQMATVWAKDSEKGVNECIVLAPQCYTLDTDNENWCTLKIINNVCLTDVYPHDPMPKLIAAYNLLLKLMGEYSVDRDRVYMTGVSAGGFASFIMAMEHPETFAAIAPDAGGADPAKVEKLKGMPIWLFFAKDDPLVVPEDFVYPTLDAMDKAGVDYKLTVYEPGTVFGTSAHFSWVPMYANTEFRNWLFAQRAQRGRT